MINYLNHAQYWVTTAVYPEALHGGTRVTCELLPSLLRTAYFVRMQDAQLALNALQSIRRAGKHKFHLLVRKYGLVVRRWRLSKRFSIFAVATLHIRHLQVGDSHRRSLRLPVIDSVQDLLLHR
jgi:hypothetical protein